MPTQENSVPLTTEAELKLLEISTHPLATGCKKKCNLSGAKIIH